MVVADTNNLCHWDTAPKMKQSMQIAISTSLRVSWVVGTAIESTRSGCLITMPNLHYVLERRDIQRRFQSAYFPDLTSPNYEAFHALKKRATGGQTYLTIDFIRKAIYREIRLESANGRYMAVQKLSERYKKQRRAPVARVIKSPWSGFKSY